MILNYIDLNGLFLLVDMSKPYLWFLQHIKWNNPSSFLRKTIMLDGSNINTLLQIITQEYLIDIHDKKGWAILLITLIMTKT